MATSATNTNSLVLSDLTVDYSQFQAQFEAYLATQGAWKGNLTTQTSQTLIDLASTIGAFTVSRLQRTFENCFPETAVSDDAILSIAQMQGLRLSRKLPSTITVTLTAAGDLTIPPLTQFSVSGKYFFNRTQIVLPANTEVSDITLYQGSVVTYLIVGLGTDRQFFVSEEDGFQISDQDVEVSVSNVIIPKSYGGLWNYKGEPAYADMTLADGRLMVIFGDSRFGTVPSTNDVVRIRYPLTDGASSNNQQLLGKAVTIDGFTGVTGTVTSNPTGGADDKSVLAYKNLSAGSFGTYDSAVTKNQYVSVIGVYPGIVDAITQAQRDINPSALEWMNVIRVSGLTNSPWGDQQKRDFIDAMQKVTMYAPRFVWQDPIPVPRDVSLDVYCFNNSILSDIQAKVEAAITDLFAAKPGILMTNFYESDLIEAAMNAAPGFISYVIVNYPTYPMLVTAPESPILTLEEVPGGGTLGSYVYQYGMSTVNNNGVEGPPSNWSSILVDTPTPNMGIKITWPPIGDTQTYKLWGRKISGTESVGLLAEIPGTDDREFIDDGSITPGAAPPNGILDIPIKYNTLGSLAVSTFFAERQQRLDSSTPYRGT